MFTPEPHHIIAIGASAGGMEEINSFFDHTPLDGVSYVIIQHLSSDFKSQMAALLSRHSKLFVREAENAMTVQSNQVYLIPNDKIMTIRKGRLYLTNKEQQQRTQLTINTFFDSLARDLGEKAIGVILSGLGSDGTEGIKAIKRSGGMVIARNPETTAFGSMPSNAIATGMVDFILEPDAMPGTIEEYVKYEEKLTAGNQDDEKNLLAIIDLIKERSPLDFSDYKQTTILRRTKRRAAYGHFTNLEHYLSFLKTAPDEVEALSKDFLISVTAFFRDKEAFEFIQTEIIPTMLKGLTHGEELKLWIAGCATGEEAYSMAILIQEQLTGINKDTIVKIFATDIDSAALVHAGKGLYNAASTQYISPERLDKFFIKEGSSYRIKTDIRKLIIFAQHDLVKNPPYCNMHFISCRNLLIYMTPVLQKKVFAMLLFGLKKDGYLFLGASENPIPIIKNLEIIHKKWKLYKNLETKRVVNFDAFSIPDLLDNNNSPSPSYSRDDPFKHNTNGLSDIVNTTLVNELNYLVVCIDEHNQVVKTYGDTTQYLLQKNFTTDLTELLPGPLAIAFNTLRNSAARSNEKASVHGIQIKHGDTSIKVNLSVSPLTNIKENDLLLMVTFSKDNSFHPSHKEIVFDENTYQNQYTINLEAELKELKLKLHSAYEQLDASNENMQSFNEELLSANEEMQSTNEEMQSVNEELHTINADHQLKNKELLELNDDLNNYFRSNINSQLIVNNDLLLIKFSPGIVNQINLLETDIGRPISNISTNIKFETITEDIKYVLTNGSVITKEIETNAGKWYQIMTMPYIQQPNNKSNGAIITFNDITELKKSQLEVDKKNKSLLRINSDLDNFVHAASHDLLAPLSNIEVSIAIMNEMKIADPRLNEFIYMIDASIKKFRTLVTDIATIAKLENDMITQEMVDMDEILNNIEWSLDNKIKTSGAFINRQLEIRHISFSKKNLRSIIYNLISNSIKFRREEAPIITIHTTQEQDTIILSIQDNGRGIPQSDIHKIFDMYGRLHQDIEGQGIGLYLAKKIINASDGNMIVESELGKGTKFTIHFKIKQY